MSTGKDYGRITEDRFMFQVPEEFASPFNGQQFTITFVNGIFHRCEFPIHGHYDRGHWKFLVYVEQKITEMENLLRKEGR